MIKKFSSPIIPVPVLIFSNKILYLFSQIGELLKTFQEKFLTIIDPNKIFDGSYPAIRREKCPKSALFVISHQGSYLKSFSAKSC